MIATIALCLFALSALADQPAFEVASVKVSNSPSNGMNGYVGIRPGGSLSMGNITLEFLISLAYGLESYRISGGPAWIASERYNINAKPAAPASRDIAMLMFQNLLAERFNLQVHHEIKTVDGYILTAPKGDFKMRKLGPADPVGFRFQQPGHIQGPGTMAMLTVVLKGSLGVPVEDQTGLTGKYEVAIEWSQNEADDGAPSIQAALSESLGLILKTRQGIHRRPGHRSRGKAHSELTAYVSGRVCRLSFARPPLILPHPQALHAASGTLGLRARPLAEGRPQRRCP